MKDQHNVFDVCSDHCIFIYLPELVNGSVSAHLDHFDHQLIETKQIKILFVIDYVILTAMVGKIIIAKVSKYYVVVAEKNL
jgi:hypothetical protein